MKSVAVIFTQPPHGSSAGREGLDALLAISAISEDTGVFFIADGVLQLMNHQQPEKVLARNYIATFGVLALYDVKACYVCAASLRERGMQPGNEILRVDCVEPDVLRVRLAQYQQILTF